MDEFIMTARGLRNNNPGNIRINDDLFQGEVRPSKDKSFKQFETMAYGYRADVRNLTELYPQLQTGHHPQDDYPVGSDKREPYGELYQGGGGKKRYSG